MKPALSILIPSIPSRFAKSIFLYNQIQKMVGEKNIEILMLTDNKKRTIGEKREALKNMSNGDFFMFVDDDDTLLSVDSVYRKAVENPTADVITFKQKCRNNDGSEYVVTFGLNYTVEHNTKDGRYLDCRRPPFHVCAWNRKFQKFNFGFVNYGEDWVFIEQCLKEARKEVFIDEIVHSYNFNINNSEASTESNQYWSNPNERKQKKKCVITLGTNEKYMYGVRRMAHSMSKYKPSDIDFFYFNSESNVGAPSHSNNPYAFKLYAIKMAREMGYDQILWLDASIVAVSDFTPVFDWLEHHGIFLETAGHFVGTWCNDYTLKYFSLSREEAMKMPMFAAGYCGFDFTNPTSIEFFAEWWESMLNGCFVGSWTDHRHDMTCGSIIANKNNLVKDYAGGGQFFAYIGEAYEQPKPTAVFHLIGL